MAEYITIAREGKKFQVKRDLTAEEQKRTWRKQKTVTETLDTAPAKIISPRLAAFKAEPARAYTDALWHIIHMPTGLVIAACDYDIIKDVKATFEAGKWTLKGTNTLVLVDDTIEFEMNCSIRYTII